MIARTRKLIERTLVERVQSRAVQQLCHRRDVLIDQGQHRRKVRNDALQDRRNGLLRSLEEEAAEVVALKKRHTVEDAARDVARINANEGVRRASVSTELDDFWIFGGKDGDIGLGSMSVVVRCMVWSA